MATGTQMGATAIWDKSLGPDSPMIVCTNTAGEKFLGPESLSVSAPEAVSVVQEECRDTDPPALFEENLTAGIWVVQHDVFQNDPVACGRGADAESFLVASKEQRALRLNKSNVKLGLTTGGRIVYR
ncbi:hypothetical protein MKX07_006681 [Trichoderma sp. CBMAI-0711]|nr:hypothetical protein MKX07_006681 [Trichoderma sp. CBMAI-0711]